MSMPLFCCAAILIYQKSAGKTVIRLSLRLMFAVSRLPVFVDDNVLRQYANEETRHAVSGFNSSPGNILDLVLSNDNNFVFNVCVDIPFSTSDHLVVKFDIMLYFLFST